MSRNKDCKTHTSPFYFQLRSLFLLTSIFVDGDEEGERGVEKLAKEVAIQHFPFISYSEPINHVPLSVLEIYLHVNGKKKLMSRQSCIHTTHLNSFSSLSLSVCMRGDGSLHIFVS